MRSYKNLTIIGTSHIAKESINEVETNLLKIRPEIIALELDKNRFNALISKERKASISDIRHLGIKGFIINLIGSFIEKQLGKKVGILPGADMKKAIEIAKIKNTRISLIDDDIKNTLKKLSKRVTLKEKLRLVKDLINGFIFKKGEKIRIDLTKVPEKNLIKKLIRELKRKYPAIYEVLVKERNQIMAKKLLALMKTNPESRIVAIVGAGHEDEITELIKNGY